MTDPISDMLTRIRNAHALRKAEVVMPYSKFKHALADLMVSHGLLERAEIADADKKFKSLKLGLKYDIAGLPVVQGLRRVSKPGQRVYSASQEIPRVRFGVGVTIVSTSKGLMTDKEARKAKVGGEVVCQIW